MFTFNQTALRLNLVAASLTTLLASASAAVFLPPSGTDAIVFGAGADQSSSGPIALPFTFNFFGSNQSQVFINTNGSLSFGAGDADTTFDIFPGLVAPTVARIAPFLDDLIVSPTASDIRFNNTISGVFGVTWNNVGIFDGLTTQSNNSVNAQVLLLGAGNPFGFLPGSILFSYGVISDASPFLSAGLNAGNGSDFAVLPTSTGSGLQGLLSRSEGIGLSNRQYLFTPTSNGFSATEVPEPLMMSGLASLALTGLGTLRARRRQKP